mmetsp:Transcript_41045/g.68191  ORF Transcript_41045/g.68191 Transcript_41045/m.68191 type:complete len:211 (+) Transcript_41045:138-770(+)
MHWFKKFILSHLLDLSTSSALGSKLTRFVLTGFVLTAGAEAFKLELVGLQSCRFCIQDFCFGCFSFSDHMLHEGRTADDLSAATAATSGSVGTCAFGCFNPVTTFSPVASESTSPFLTTPIQPIAAACAPTTAGTALRVFNCSTICLRLIVCASIARPTSSHACVAAASMCVASSLVLATKAACIFSLCAAHTNSASCISSHPRITEPTT